MKKTPRVQKPVKTLVIYYPKKGKERQLSALIKKHWRTLHKLGLATNEPAVVYQAKDGHSNKTIFVEIFSWKDSKASSLAHSTPEVMAIWNPMMPILETMSHSTVK